MTLSCQELQTIATLAYIDVTPHDSETLAKDVSAIMDFIEQLRGINTEGVTPLLHPLELQQRLRSDEVTETNHIEALAKLTPFFSDNVYLVPNIMDKGQ